MCENYTASNIHLLPRGHGLKGLGVKWIHSYYWVEILLLNYVSNPAILGKKPPVIKYEFRCRASQREQAAFWKARLMFELWFDRALVIPHGGGCPPQAPWLWDAAISDTQSEVSLPSPRYLFQRMLTLSVIMWIKNLFQLTQNHGGLKAKRCLVKFWLLKGQSSD